MQPEQSNLEVTEKENISVETNVVQENTPQETPEQINWKKFREAREAERKQKEAAEKRALEKEQEAAALKAAMEAILNKPQIPQRGQAPSNYYEEDLTEEQRIENKIAEMMAIKERQAEQERLQREQREYPQRLAATYSDFNSICSAENLDYLEYHYPEIAESFSHRPEGFDKWSAVYKAVKKLVPNATNSRKDQMRAEQNFNKPQSMAVPGVTQVGDTAPVKLDDKRRADNWARMQKIMRGG